MKSAEIVVLGDSGDNDSSSVQPFFTLTPAIYFVPGVGQVGLLATGAIVVGGVTMVI
ncbi:hypothetical protein [Pseudogracilibacillus sp. SO30301A]|uniref:hypothetical protein n=1 Tax=Pseudogracilibacillus sp. SO30301A TaxID=3098291 RepID=UPI00300E2598